jgi:hypothetical protein
LPRDKFKDFSPPPETIPRTIGHYKEWVEAAKGGKPANCHFDFAGLIAETALIGVVSSRVRRDLTWDSASMQFPGDSEATALLSEPYRTGWTL